MPTPPIPPISPDLIENLRAAFPGTLPDLAMIQLPNFALHAAHARGSLAVIECLESWMLNQHGTARKAEAAKEA